MCGRVPSYTRYIDRERCLRGEGRWRCLSGWGAVAMPEWGRGVVAVHEWLGVQ